MENPPDEFKTLCQHLGQVVIYWAVAEQALDTCVKRIFDDLGGRALARDVPISLDNKIAFLKSAIKKLPLLAHLNQEIGKAITEFVNLKESRHQLVHAAIANTTPTAKGFLFGKLKYAKDQDRLQDIFIQPAELIPLSNRILSLADHTADLGASLIALAESQTPCA